jgi:hypothetical protein
LPHNATFILSNLYSHFRPDQNIQQHQKSAPEGAVLFIRSAGFLRLYIPINPSKAERKPFYYGVAISATMTPPLAARTCCTVSMVLLTTALAVALALTVQIMTGHWH